MNLKISSNQPFTTNEIMVDNHLKEILASHNDIYIFLICIFSHDITSFKYFYETKTNLLQTD